MRKLLLATTALLALSALPARAEAILHVNDNQPPAGPSTTEPVVINSNTQFFVQQTANTTTAAPLFLYFLDGPTTPTITSAFLNSVPPSVGITGPVLDGTYTLGSGQDSFYKGYLNCSSCTASINDQNIKDAYLANFGTAAPTTLTVYKATIDGGFVGNQFYEINGTFANGTIIAPFMDTNVTTSWTNAGLIDGVPPVPEPATWAMMLLGFIGIAGMAGRKSWQGFRLA